MLYDTAPDLSYLHVFGYLSFARTLSVHRKKFDKRSRKPIYLGVQFSTKCHILFDFQNREIIIFRDTTFFEYIFPFSIPKVTTFPLPIATQP